MDAAEDNDSLMALFIASIRKQTPDFKADWTEIASILSSPEIEDDALLERLTEALRED